VLHEEAPAPSVYNPEIPAALDAIVLHGLAKQPELRIASARVMAEQLEALSAASAASDVVAWINRVAHEQLIQRAHWIESIERASMELEVPRSSRRAPLPLPQPAVVAPEEGSATGSVSSLARDVATRRPTATVVAWAAVSALAVLAMVTLFLVTRGVPRTATATRQLARSVPLIKSAIRPAAEARSPVQPAAKAPAARVAPAPAKPSAAAPSGPKGDPDFETLTRE
jgi:hypothetical protein